MDARATRRGIPAGVIWGGFGVLAWAALTALTGGGSAHADEQPSGPLDGLTSLVSETVSAVTAPVTPVVEQVVAPVAPVVQQVVAPVAPVVQQVVAPVQQAAPAVVDTVTETVAQAPVVGSVATPVLEAVSHTTQAVVAPVTGILTDSPVSQITDPVLDLVTGLPIVGKVVDDLGAIDLIDGVVGIVDDTTGLIGGVVDETVPPVLEAIDPAVPGAAGGPRAPTSPAVPGRGSAGSGTTAVAVQPSSAAASVVPSKRVPGPASDLSASAVIAAEHASGEQPSSPNGGADVPSGAPAGAPVSPTSSAGPGGSSASVHARLSDVGALPLSAWERASGSTDDALPTSPVADTDVSPD
ncbi:hypothetical protein [Microbacterium sp. 179-I 3D3 NHS]|uniref:hypothetical protein n=1 Tax=Microbacterium sp. 179-I 3D3 NHS TaxID=3142382 RepID=UPI0039A00D6A